MSQSVFEKAMGKGRCPVCGRLVQRKRDFALRKHAGCDYVDDSDLALHWILRDAALLPSDESDSWGYPYMIPARDGRNFQDFQAVAPHEPLIHLRQKN